MIYKKFKISIIYVYIIFVHVSVQYRMTNMITRITEDDRKEDKYMYKHVTITYTENVDFW